MKIIQESTKLHEMATFASDRIFREPDRQVTYDLDAVKNLIHSDYQRAMWCCLLLCQYANDAGVDIWENADDAEVFCGIAEEALRTGGLTPRKFARLQRPGNLDRYAQFILALMAQDGYEVSGDIPDLDALTKANHVELSDDEFADLFGDLLL